MTGAPGRVSFMLSGGVGFFSWDVEELGERNSDIALDFGVGLDYRLNRRLILFGDYTWWWVYHEKDDNIVTNTARMNILRAGLRLVVI
jgi:predicted porin